MAREKRPAEPTVSSRPKRLRTSAVAITTLSSPAKEYQDTCLLTITSLGDSQEDEERLTQEIQSKLEQLKIEHTKRTKACKGFEDRIKKEQMRLTQRVEAATEKIVERRERFKAQMLPVLIVALQELSSPSYATLLPEEVLNVKTRATPGILQDATKVLRSCSDLVTCYHTTTSIPLLESTASRTKQKFDIDKDETMRAFESAKKMTINHLQMGLADKTEDSGERFKLDDEEYHLARKVLNRGKGTRPTGDSMGMGNLLYDFGRMVRRMQGIIER